MRLLFRLSILVAITAVVASAMPANATCALASQFNGAYGALNPPINPPDVTRLKGNFWGLGQGNVATGSGTDNGSWPADAGGATDWARFGYGVYYIAGDWAGDTRIDGCIQDPPNPQPAKMVYTLQDADANCGWFSVQCIEEDTLANFDFSVNGLANNMELIPTPSIVTTSRDSITFAVTITAKVAAVPAGGVRTDAACSGATLVTGAKIYYKAVPRDAAAPATRDATQWSVLGTGGINADVTGTIPCDTNQDIYLAAGLTFDSGFETGYVSCNTTKVQCGPQIAIRPADDFRVVPRPDRKPVRTR